MKKIYFLCFAISLLVIFHAPVIANDGATRIKKENVIQPVRTKDTVILLKDLRIQISEAKKGDDKAGSWEKQMPWIVSLAIGLLAFGTNMFVSYNSRRTNLETAQNQLANATTLSLAQIKQSRENNERDFNKTVMSGNRQNWITEFRNLISEILSSMSSFIIKGTVSDSEHTAFKLLIIKAELMLTNDIDGPTVKVLNDTLECCLKIAQGNAEVEELSDMMEKIRLAAVSKLKETWEKVKKGA